MTTEEWQKAYDEQRTWSDKFIPRMIDLLAEVLKVNVEDIRISSQEEDIRDGVDVVILEKFHVGLRIRKYHHLKTYGNQFTIRNKKNRFQMTELDKVKAGKLHGLLYAFADEASTDGTATGIACWRLLRMKALKLALEGDSRFSDVTAYSGSYDHCRFHAYEISSFPPKSLVIASS